MNKGPTFKIKHHHLNNFAASFNPNENCSFKKKLMKKNLNVIYERHRTCIVVQMTALKYRKYR